MTITPFPPQITKSEVLKAAQEYEPQKPPPPCASVLVWVGSVLFISGVLALLSVFGPW